MKKLFLSLFLIALGAGSWFLISRTARFSIKKWDAKFGAVLRQGLDSAGLSNQDILSSVNEIKNDENGEWVVHRIEIKLPSKAVRDRLRKELENSGAHVTQKTLEGGAETLHIRRGSRIYQEITFLN